MDASDGPSGLFGTLEESLCRDDGIEFAVTFGSRSTGDSRPSSDLDIAVKFTDDLSADERFRKRCFLSGTLQRSDAPFVDLSDVEELPVDVAHDAADGDLLCGDERAFRQWTEDTDATFKQRRENIRRHQRGVIDRIAEDGLRG